MINTNYLKNNCKNWYLKIARICCRIKKYTIKKHIHNKYKKQFKYWFLEKIAFKYLKKKKLKKIYKKTLDKQKLLIKKYTFFKKWQFINKRYNYQKKTLYNEYKNNRPYINFSSHLFIKKRPFFLKPAIVWKNIILQKKSF